MNQALTPSIGLAKFAALLGLSVALATKPWTAAGLPILIAVGVASAILLAAEGDLFRAPRPTHILPLGVGIGAFWLGRELGSGFGVQLSAFGIFAILVAAVAEEMFFRGVLHNALSSRMPWWAVGLITSAAFALIHVPTYGVVILPIDMAAGLLLWWQREATGSWVVPALTHMSANLMQMG